jgi:streptogramin lyase
MLPAAAATTTCSLTPQLRSVTINQGLGSYQPLVRGKETLVRLYLSLPSCAAKSATITLQGATLTVNAAGTLSNTISAPTPAVVSPFPSIASYTAATAVDSPADPKFVVPGTDLQPPTTAAFTASFTATVTYSAGGAAPATASFTSLSGSTTAITATVERKTNALRILVVPMGDASQAASTQFTSSGQSAVQDGMLQVSRIYPVPSGVSSLTQATGGLRYTINAGMLDLGPNGLKLMSAAVSPPALFCGSSANFDLVKGQLATFLLAWNTANPTATADRVLGVADQAVSKGSSSGCAEGMASVGNTEGWARAIYSTSPSITGGVIAMEIAHTLGLVPASRYDPYSPYHSPNTLADASPLQPAARTYNVSQRSYVSDNHTVMDFAGTFNGANTLLEQPDYQCILFFLGGAAPAGIDCGTGAPVGSANGVGTNPTFVMSGTTKGTMADTSVVDSYFAAGVARTTPEPASRYRLLMKQGGTVMQDFGVPVSFANDDHDGSPLPGTPGGTTNTPVGLFSVAYPFDTAFDTIEFWNGEPASGGVLLYSRNRQPTPIIKSTSSAPCAPTIATFPTPSSNSSAPKITTGPDGNMWFAEGQADSIGRSTPAGVITEFPVPKWLGTGSMSASRLFASSILLTGGPNAGRVLVAGGYASGAPSLTPLASAELYDPTTGTWSPTGSMTVSRAEFTLTRLISGSNAGKILAAGGETSGLSGNAFASTAELYDPIVGTWSPTASMKAARMEQTATVLGDGSGKVLVAGGWNGGALSSAELYDPTTMAWSTTPGNLVAARTQHIAALLSTGKVLVAGGYNGTALASAELFDPSTGMWSATGSMTTSRLLFAAATLGNGKILVAGGKTIDAILKTAELYDPGLGTWSGTGSMTVARGEHTATLLNNGKVLVTGGSSDPKSEVYDPAAGTWSVTGSMTTARFEHTATLLGSGSVLVAGGLNSSALASAEIYSPSILPNGITTGPDGNLWFTEAGANKIGRLIPSSDGIPAITQFRLPHLFSGPGPGIAAGPDGNLWFTEPNGNRIGRIVPSGDSAGQVTEYNDPGSFPTPNDIVAGPDGSMWFTDDNSNDIGRITTGGTITQFPLPSAESFPVYITQGPDGGLWFTEQFGNKVGRITPGAPNTITEFAIPTAASQPAGITNGPDGNLWFAERASSKIASITPAGSVSEFTASEALFAPVGITTGPDRNVWFTQFNGSIGKLTPCVVSTTFTVTTSVLPALATLDCYFVDGSSGGVAYPFAVGVKSTTSSLSCSFDPSLAPQGTTVQLFVDDGFTRSPGTTATVTSAAKPPVATIDNPLSTTRGLQFDNIALRGGASDPQTGQLSGSALQWSLTGPGLSRSASGAIVDLSPPGTSGWPTGTYSATLTATDANGTSQASVTFTIDGDAENDGISETIETKCGVLKFDQPGVSDAYADLDGDGIPNIDDIALGRDPCTPVVGPYSALIISFPQKVYLGSTSNTFAAGIAVPYRDIMQVTGSSVQITRIGNTDVSANPLFTNPNNSFWAAATFTGIDHANGGGLVIFQLQNLISYLKQAGISSGSITITISGSGTTATGTWQFQAVTSAQVFPGSPPSWTGGM